MKKTLEQKLFKKIPSHLQRGLKLYIEKHNPTGGFLEAVLSNDLKESFGRADFISRAGLEDIVAFLYNCAPSSCWGSSKKYKTWISKAEEE